MATLATPVIYDPFKAVEIPPLVLVVAVGVALFLWGFFILVYPLLCAAVFFMQASYVADSWAEWTAADPVFADATDGGWPPSAAVKWETFADEVRRIIDTFPEETQLALEGVAVVAAYEPTIEEMRAAGRDLSKGETAAGIFGGASHGQRNQARYAYACPTFIKFYFGPIYGANGQRWREALRGVVVHEVGHALGMDHDAMARLGY